MIKVLGYTSMFLSPLFKLRERERERERERTFITSCLLLGQRVHSRSGSLLPGEHISSFKIRRKGRTKTAELVSLKVYLP